MYSYYVGWLGIVDNDNSIPRKVAENMKAVYESIIICLYVVIYGDLQPGLYMALQGNLFTRLLLVFSVLFCFLCEFFFLLSLW